jgi:rubrerythrin
MIVAVAVSCASPKPKTIENLRDAITGETGASANYQAFSAKAAAEGYYNIAKMFAAASAAEAIHVRNHNAVLVTMNEEPFTPAAGTPTVNSTIANLMAAIEGETYEFTVVAETEKNTESAIKSFAWASDAETTHAIMYDLALEILQATGSDEEVSAEWYVCPKCGDLFDSIEGFNNCSICGTRTSFFRKF